MRIKLFVPQQLIFYTLNSASIDVRDIYMFILDILTVVFSYTNIPQFLTVVIQRYTEHAQIH